MRDYRNSWDEPVKLKPDDFRITQKIGRGNFSDVYLVETSIVMSKTDRANASEEDDALIESLNHHELALKRLNSHSIKSMEYFKRAARDLIEEGLILSKVNHPNIIDLCGISDIDPQAFLRSEGYFSDYFLLLPVLSETLQDRLERWSRDDADEKRSRASRQFRKFFPFLKRRNKKNHQKIDAMKMMERIDAVAAYVASAMEYLHSIHIIFQDLKPENIGFDIESDEVKLFDFGLATTVDPSTGTMLGSSEHPISWEGTPRYMAPEVFQGRGGSKQADVYSFGILLYVLCTLNSEFGPRRLAVLQNYVCAGGRPTLNDTIPDKATRTLISDCLSSSPSQRPSFHEILNVHLPKILIPHKSDWTPDTSETGNTSAVSSIVSIPGNQ
eukprot:scaffold14608_cov102-Cylindrotheca_fusiformis.AAC.5